MLPNRPRRTEKLFLAAEPELRAAIEREAFRRDTSMSSTIRALIRAQLARGQENFQATGVVS